MKQAGQANAEQDEDLCCSITTAIPVAGASALVCVRLRVGEASAHGKTTGAEQKRAQSA